MRCEVKYEIAARKIQQELQASPLSFGLLTQAELKEIVCMALRISHNQKPKNYGH
jgi:hypothetical protein